ncbi:MAG: GNAT family N-acetyltransferase [Clostridia bacterium]|nr:GNAT family N-acetyltransferase [Clostridia bacterium]
MRFVKSKSMKVSVFPEQVNQLLSKERIESACLKSSVLAFDIYQDDLLIGFVMVRQFDIGQYFLWNYAIDFRYQNQKYGTKALLEFISYMKKKYHMSVLTTTYLWGNDNAKKLYEKIGFLETDVVDEDNCHEVNMIYHCI